MSTTSSELPTTYCAEPASGISGAARLGTRLAAVIRETLHTWHLRATVRPQLARLNDHKLRDIGMTRAEAEYEAAKPFWQA